MKNTFLFICLLSIVIFISCSNNKLPTKFQLTNNFAITIDGAFKKAIADEIVNKKIQKQSNENLVFLKKAQIYDIDCDDKNSLNPCIEFYAKKRHLEAGLITNSSIGNGSVQSKIINELKDNFTKRKYQLFEESRKIIEDYSSKNINGINLFIIKYEVELLGHYGKLEKAEVTEYEIFDGDEWVTLKFTKLDRDNNIWDLLEKNALASLTITN